MQLQRLFRVLCLLAVWFISGGAGAAATYTGRTSDLNVTWLYGGGEDAIPGGASTGSTSLFGDPAVSLVNSFSDFGQTIHDTSWGVLLSYSATQQVAPSLAGPYLSGFSASGSSSVSSTVSGVAFSDLNVQSPGNQLIVYFSVDAPTTYSLTGTLQSTDVFDAAPSVYKGDSEFRIDRFDNFSQAYQAIYFKNSQGDGVETLSVANGSFSAGLYRLMATSKVRAFSSEQNSATWDFSITLATPPVPEPGEWAMLLAGLLLVARAARRQGAPRRPA